MKILVTGNMGYIGPCVVEKLRSAYPKATLVGLDVGYFANCLTNSAILPECRLDQQYFVDMRDVTEDMLTGVTAVVHLAGISNDPMGNNFEAVTFDINHTASMSFAAMAKAKGVTSFVFASSCSMYGSADDTPRKESSQTNPLTAYAKSKAYMERDLQALADDKFTVTCLRFSTACGMSERLRLDLVLNDFVAGAVASKQITVLSDGTPWRPLINIKDMARAIDWSVSRPADNGGQFLAVNVGSDEWNYQVKELTYAVAEVMPGVTVSINKDAQPDKRSYRVDFSLFKQLAPNHQPIHDLKSTILELKAGLEAMHFNNPDFRNSRFMRLKVLSELRAGNLIDDKLEWS
jgi:nucleoside-diphosphate-sugar epimerase